ncbi:MAG: hypothetical protein AAF985_10960 [Bacteroidota bacterium]
MSFAIKEVILSLHFDQYQSEREQPQRSNTDVIVIVEEIEEEQVCEVSYTASFFAYKNISDLIVEHQQSGDFLAGTYFYAKHMLLIKDCSKATILKVIDDLIEEGSFKEVFLKN